MPNSDYADEVDCHFADGLFVKSLAVHKAGMLVPQHAHALDHLTFVAAGEIMVWKNGSYAGRLAAPSGMMIEAGVKHAFLTVVDGTTLLCIHNLHSERAVRVLEEHQISADDARELFEQVT